MAPDSSSIRVSTWGRGVWELSVSIPVTITTQPANATAAIGHAATFSVVASGNGTLTYQWKRDGVPILGATNTSYTTSALTNQDSGTAFTCEVTGPLGPVTSNPAIVVVLALGTATTSTNATATAIPDATSTAPGAAVDIPFVVSGVSGNVGEVTFSLYLTHTYVGDLVVSLIAPDNTTVILSNNAGSSGPTGSPTEAAFGTSCGNYVVFSDLGGSSIAGQVSPPAIVGTFRPSFALDAFNGKAPNGTWKTRFQDFGLVDTGSFQCGVLTVKPLVGVSLDLNGDGSGDLRDLLFFAKYYGTANATCDLNGTGTVDDRDLNLILAGL